MIINREILMICKVCRFKNESYEKMKLARKVIVVI